MSAQALLKRFDIVADQSANIPALRRLVVDLAVRGKLLPTEELDMDVPEMLRRISAKVNELALSGLIKKQKPLSKIGNDEVPAAYLAHCAFARLGNIANLQKGLTGIQSSMPGEYPLVVTAAERGTCDHFDFDGAAAIIPLVSSTGHGNASINRLHYQEGKFALGTILCAVLPFDEQLISARFLYEYLTAFKKELLVSKMIGTANVTLTLGKIADVPVPILAPAVQKRVDELMTLCDQLEAAQQERERRRDRLAAASLQRLNLPAPDATAEAQREHARFHLQNLPRLTTRPEHIKAMRQTVLALAVRGLLVNQNPEDELAEKLLNRVNNQRVVRRKFANLDLQNPDSSISAIPSSWTWTVIDRISADSEASITDGPFGANLKTEHYIQQPGYRVIRLQNIGRGYFRNEHLAYVDHERFDLLSKHHVQPGDLVVAGLVDPTVRCAELPKDVGPALVKADCYRFAVHKEFSTRFALYYLNSPLCQSFATVHHHGMTLTRIGLGNFRKLPFPLPPLAEQHRIVAKVDELMALCDQLEAQLATTKTDSRRLLEAVLEAALAPA